MIRVFNVSAVPAFVPEQVLRRAAREILEWRGSGRSTTESHEA